jgi:hypothetical protein
MRVGRLERKIRRRGRRVCIGIVWIQLPFCQDVSNAATGLQHTIVLTKLPNSHLQHLILSCKRLRLGLIESTLVSASRLPQ